MGNISFNVKASAIMSQECPLKLKSVLNYCYDIVLIKWMLATSSYYNFTYMRFGYNSGNYNDNENGNFSPPYFIVE